MSGELSVAQLVEAARRDVAAKPAPSVKTASAQAPTDIGTDTATLLSLAKIGKQLAERMAAAEKRAADDLEGKSGVQSSGPASGEDKGTLVTTGTKPDQHFVAPTGKTDTSASSGPYGVPDQTSAKPGPDSLVPGVGDNPTQTTPPTKTGAMDPVRTVHDNYASAAAKLGQAGVAQPNTATGPLAALGGGKPESTQASSDTSGGDKPPTTEEGVKGTTRQETHRDAVAATQDKEKSLPGTTEAATSSVEGALDKVLDEAKMSSVKAAAFRQWYGQLDPNSKLACALRNRMAAKMGQVDPTIPPPTPPAPGITGGGTLRGVGGGVDLPGADRGAPPVRPAPPVR